MRAIAHKCANHEFFPQALRDLAAREEDADDVSAQDKANWKLRARAFLRKEKGKPEDKKKHKKDRLPAYDHLIAVDHMLLALTGKGLNQFKPKDHNTILMVPVFKL